MSIDKITEAEWKVMHILWQLRCATSSQVIDEIVPLTGWSPRTVRTLLRRLAEKGVLASKKVRGSEKEYVSVEYTPRFSREECAAVHSRSFMDRVFNGNASELIVHFVKESQLSEQEVAELRDMLAKIPGTSAEASQNPKSKRDQKRR